MFNICSIGNMNSFNRTFMELKLEMPTPRLVGKRCFNRTFMELKLVTKTCLLVADRF